MAKSGAKWSKETTKWMEGFVIGTLCNYHKQKHTNSIYTVRGYILFIKSKQHKFFHVDTKKEEKRNASPPMEFRKSNSDYFTTNF